MFWLLGKCKQNSVEEYNDDDDDWLQILIYLLFPYSHHFRLLNGLFLKNPFLKCNANCNVFGMCKFSQEIVQRFFVVLLGSTQNLQTGKGQNIWIFKKFANDLMSFLTFNYTWGN